jgi:hypothetical protein
LRRPSRSEKAGITIDPDGTVPDKKRKVEASIKEEPTLSLSDIEEYNEHCKHLQKVYYSHKWTEVGMATLLEETAAQRTKWILQESPTVAVILEKFPCLKEPKLILSELCRILGNDKAAVTAKWHDTEERVLRYAAQDGRKAVNGLFKQYNARRSDEESADRRTTYSLLLLTALLQRKGGLGRMSLLTTFKGESIDIDKSLEGVDCPAPFIAAFGVDTDSLTDIKVIIEKNNVIEMPSLATAIHCCFTSYFIFNISYPLHFTPLLLFLEYIYGMKPSQKKLPISVCTLIDSLEKAYRYQCFSSVHFTTLFYIYSI